MPLSKADKIRLYCGIALSVFTAVIGALLLMQVISIYNSGPAKPFTREIVSEHLSAIALPCILWVACVVASAVLNCVFPVGAKTANKISPVKTLSRFSARLPKEAEANEAYKPLKTRKIVILACKIVAFAVAGVTAVICILYLFTLNNLKGLEGWDFSKGITGAFAFFFNAKNFDTDPTKGVIAMMAHLLPWIGATLTCFSLLTVIEYFTAKKTLPVAKGLVAEYAKQGYKISTQAKTKKQHPRAVMITRIALAVVAIAFIIVGAVNGGAYDVFIKAINICTECIGLG